MVDSTSSGPIDRYFGAAACADMTRWENRGGIDALEKGQAFGTRSKQELSQSVFDRVVTIEWSKRDTVE